MAGLTTHVLDTSIGKPAHNILIELFFLNNDDMKIFWIFCNSLTLISFILCADPRMIKSVNVEYERWLNFLLKEGKYTPSSLNFKANLKLFASKNLFPFFLKKFFNFKSLSILIFDDV